MTHDGKDDLTLHDSSEMHIPSQNDHHRAPSLSDTSRDPRGFGCHGNEHRISHRPRARRPLGRRTAIWISTMRPRSCVWFRRSRTTPMYRVGPAEPSRTRWASSSRMRRNWGGWYTELMNAIGEAKSPTLLPISQWDASAFISFRRASATGGRWLRVRQGPVERQLRHPNQRLPALRPRSPLVEFYDVSQDPAKFPEGQLSPATTCPPCSAWTPSAIASEKMSALGLDGGVPNWTIRGDDLQEVYAHLCAAREQLESYTECGTYKDYGFGFHAKRGRCRVTSSVSQSRKDGGARRQLMTSQTVTPTTTSPMTS